MSEIHEVQCTERESIDINFICEMQDSMSEETVLFYFWKVYVYSHIVNIYEINV